MKKIGIIALLLLTACDDVIHPTLQSADPVYVVDAFVSNKLDSQIVHLMLSQPYFEELVPPGVSGASVTITDNHGGTFSFTEDLKHPGSYFWLPSTTGLGTTGYSYTLSIDVKGEHFSAESRMGRVPHIDSVTFKQDERIDGTTDFYTGQFWARDLPGVGDTYWIRAWKNGVMLNKPREINIAYDAAFAKGSTLDGVTFIQPIRNGINPRDTDDNDRLISPYMPGDSVYVEIYSVTEASFDFLSQVNVQTDRPGGFSELFAQPLANVPTNIVNANPAGTKAQGFFNVGAASGLGARFKK